MPIFSLFYSINTYTGFNLSKKNQLCAIQKVENDFNFYSKCFFVNNLIENVCSGNCWHIPIALFTVFATNQPPNKSKMMARAMMSSPKYVCNERFAPGRSSSGSPSSNCAANSTCLTSTSLGLNGAVCTFCRNRSMFFA